MPIPFCLVKMQGSILESDRHICVMSKKRPTIALDATVLDMNTKLQAPIEELLNDLRAAAGDDLVDRLTAFFSRQKEEEEETDEDGLDEQ